MGVMLNDMGGGSGEDLKVVAITEVDEGVVEALAAAFDEDPHQRFYAGNALEHLRAVRRWHQVGSSYYVVIMEGDTPVAFSGWSRLKRTERLVFELSTGIVPSHRGTEAYDRIKALQFGVAAKLRSVVVARVNWDNKPSLAAMAKHGWGPKATIDPTDTVSRRFQFHPSWTESIWAKRWPDEVVLQLVDSMRTTLGLPPDEGSAKAA